MIPRIIHYCWFGRNEKPDVIKRCIESWRRNCPDWEIKEWNEDNFDVTTIPYMKSAYDAKKWAFVSDVARLLVIYQYGGVYLDTDVELLQKHSLEQYLDYEVVLAFENARGINSGLIYGASKNASFTKRLLEPYETIDFSEKQPIVNTIMNDVVFRNEFPLLKYNGKTQVYDGCYIMGTGEYGSIMKHYGTRTWCDNLPQYKISEDNMLKRFLRNPHIFEVLERSRVLKKIVPVYEFVAYDLLDLGLIYFIKRQVKKIRNRKK